ncbi:MAG: transporter [Massilia sp.]|jgi:polar amino acid transport system substrate-binding protein|nr:transporter [Massilia sp.]
MKRIKLLLLGCGALAILSRPAQAQQPTLRLASLEWLPYASRALPQGGVSAAVAKAVAARIGYAVEVDYLPWKRAMMAGSGPGFAGYFPAYYTAGRARRCHFSAPIGHSTVGLAVRAGQPLHWRTLDDLVGNKLGVVLGYSNGEHFDAMVEQGKLSVDYSASDVVNLRKLLAGRVNAVVIDQGALRYLLASDPGLKAQRERLAFEDHALADLTLHVCFQRHARGQKLQRSFDAALRTTDIRKIEDQYFEALERTTGAVVPVAGRR